MGLDSLISNIAELVSVKEVEIVGQLPDKNFFYFSVNFRGTIKKTTTVYLKTLSKLRLNHLSPTLFLANLFLTQC